MNGVWAEEVLRARGGSLPPAELHRLTLLATGDKARADRAAADRALEIGEAKWRAEK